MKYMKKFAKVLDNAELNTENMPFIPLFSFE